MDQEKFDKLLKDVQKLSKELNELPIFIGGIATYLYSQEYLLQEVMTHDADLFIGYGEYYQLEDIYGPLKFNPALSKMEIIVNQIDFDVYLEDQSDLIYSYQEMLPKSKILNSVRVPAPEHLLALKLKAAIRRINSDRGTKDKADIIKLISISSKEINNDILSDGKFPLKELESFLDLIRKDNALIHKVALDFQQEKLLKKELDNYFDLVRKKNLENNLENKYEQQLPRQTPTFKRR